MNLITKTKQHFVDSIAVKTLALESVIESIVLAGTRMANALAQDHKILSCGNGGSAADAQHFSAELLNRFEMERPPLAAIALSTDTSTLTSIANDYHYDEIFAKQVTALGRKDDILLAISTSGDSQNVCRAIEVAQHFGMQVIALTGKNGGKISKILKAQDIEIRVPSERTMRIQEVHLLIIHCLCDLIDTQLFQNEKAHDK